MRFHENDMNAHGIVTIIPQNLNWLTGQYLLNIEAEGKTNDSRLPGPVLWESRMLSHIHAWLTESESVFTMSPCPRVGHVAILTWLVIWHTGQQVFLFFSKKNTSILSLTMRFQTFDRKRSEPSVSCRIFKKKHHAACYKLIITMIIE